jgi:hypothetical protein
VTYAGAQYWDQYFLRLRESGHDLDWEGQWTEPFQQVWRGITRR